MATPGAIVQVGTATTGGAGSTGSFSVTKPTGVQEDDVLLVFGASNEGAWDTLPSGFVQFEVSTDANTPNLFRCYGWYKICGPSEPASYSFGSTTAAGAGAPMVAIVSAWRNVDTSSPIMNQSRAEGGAATEPANPATSFSQSGNGRLFFFRGVRAGTTIATFTNGTASWTEEADAGFFSGGSISYSATLVAHDFDTGAGARTEPATTCSQAETDNVYLLGALRALPPADTDTGSGTEGAESIDGTAVNTDTGTGAETESISIPIADSDSGTGAEGAENIVITAHHIASDNFNRTNETTLNVASSGAVWTNV